MNGVMQNSPASVKDLIRSVSVADLDDIVRAAQALHDFVNCRAEMRVAVSHNIAARRTPVDADGAFLAQTVFGWDGEKSSWWRNPRYTLLSPIPAACRYETDVFWVNADGFHTKQPNHHIDAIDLSNFESFATSRSAMVAPIHLTFGQIGGVSFNPTDPDKTDLSKEYAEFGDEFATAARAFVRSYVSVIGDVSGLPPQSKLSKREAECLRWAAVGKTDQEIGMILSRSRATVRFHIHNASVKLDAVNRSQTVFKAAQLGYIRFPK